MKGVTWVLMRHDKHGWETYVPEMGVSGYKENGWSPKSEKKQGTSVKKDPSATDAAAVHPAPGVEKAASDTKKTSNDEGVK